MKEMLTIMNFMDEFPFPFDLHDRITSVLAPFSGMDKIPAEILKKAADRGTWVHEQIKNIEQGWPTDTDHPEWNGYLESYRKWAVGRVFIKTPDRFYDDSLMITGECDAIEIINGELFLVDYKTSAKEGSTWKYQGAAYEYLARRKGYDIKGITFQKLDKDGKCPHTYVYTGTSFKRFERLLETYREFFRGNNKMDLGDIE